MPRPHYSRYPLYSRLGGPRSWSESPVREKISCPCCLLLGRPARSPVTIQITVCRILTSANNSNVKKSPTNKMSPLIWYMACEILLASPLNQITRGESDRVFEVSLLCVCVCVWVGGVGQSLVKETAKLLVALSGTVSYLI